MNAETTPIMAEKKKFELEYLVKSSPKILYNFLSTPSGLSEWFSDDVNIKNDVYSFFWDGSEDEAKLVGSKDNEFVKFKWLHSEGDESFFEMRIKVDELTGDVALIITDFAEEDEIEESRLLWDHQISDLLKVLGS